MIKACPNILVDKVEFFLMLFLQPAGTKKLQNHVLPVSIPYCYAFSLNAIEIINCLLLVCCNFISKKIIFSDVIEKLKIRVKIP
jgi:hypothetical protein